MPEKITIFTKNDCDPKNPVRLIHYDLFDIRTVFSEEPFNYGVISIAAEAEVGDMATIRVRFLLDKRQKKYLKSYLSLGYNIVQSGVLDYTVKPAKEPFLGKYVFDALFPLYVIK